MLRIFTVGLPLPFMDQVPEYDPDAGCAHGGPDRVGRSPFPLWLSIPSPSIETLASRGLSPPPGAFVPIYLVAKMLHVQPSVPMAPWASVVRYHRHVQSRWLGPLWRLMRSRKLVAGLVGLGVFALWLYTVWLRRAYMNQIPVYDADGISGEAHMWARMWWDEGPLQMWFSTPLAPRSIETPTLAARTLYESWPPGAFVPIYLIAKILGIEPSIPLVNCVNTSLHGLIALAVAFIAFNLALLNRMGNLSSGAIALGVSFPILLSPALIFVFSQIYDVVTSVLIYVAVFILIEVLFYRARSAREKRIVTTAQLITIYLAFLVDWLAYNLFAFWIVSRLAAGYLGVEARLTLRRLACLLMLPISAFAIYLIWRFFAPGSLGRTYGIAASANQLLGKVLERMNLTDESHITGFGKAFIEMHGDYLAQPAFPLLVGSTLISMVLLVISFRRAADARERRIIFATLSVLVLILVPNYVHMLILYQHTYIHPWAMTKAMSAYALIPFALLPISVFTLARQAVGKAESSPPRLYLQAAGLILALTALVCSLEISNQPFHFLGRVNRDQMLMWDDIGRNTLYQDVVVSPVLEADPITKEIGASYKLVHHADNFTDVDKVVAHVCGDFNVVLALPKDVEIGEFASRQSTLVIDTGRIRLLRFASYPGKAIGCP